MGSSQTKKNDFFNLKAETKENDFTSWASFYEGLDNLSTDPADPRITHSKAEQKLVRQVAAGYVQDNPDLTQQQKEEVLSGGQDKHIWPMARCISFCKMAAYKTKDGELDFKMDKEHFRENMGNCLDQACNVVQHKMNACLDKQYSSKSVEHGATSDDLMLVEPGFTSDDLMLAQMEDLEDHDFFKNTDDEGYGKITSSASFYKDLDNLRTDPAHPGIVSSERDRELVRLCAKKITSCAHPDLTQQQKEEILSGKQDKHIWPMVRCQQFCAMAAYKISTDEEGMQWLLARSQLTREEIFRKIMMKCLDQAEFNQMSKKMDASLAEEYN